MKPFVTAHASSRMIMVWTALSLVILWNACTQEDHPHPTLSTSSQTSSSVVVESSSTKETTSLSEWVPCSEDAAPPILNPEVSPYLVKYNATYLGVFWEKATDDCTLSDELEYQIYSVSDDKPFTLDSVYAGKPLLTEWTKNIASSRVGGFEYGHLYYIVILVMDAAQNEERYLPISIYWDSDVPVLDPEDTSNPVSVDSITTKSVSLSWSSAKSTSFAARPLEYCIIQSDSEMMESFEEVYNQGTMVVSWTENMTTFVIEDLVPDSVYHFYICVRDEHLNVFVYPVLSITTLHSDIPQPGDGGTVQHTIHDSTYIDLSWQPALDAHSDSSLLQYRMYYSQGMPFTTLQDVDANGIALTNWLVNETFFQYDAVQSGIEYCFAVVVKDSNDNRALYQPFCVTSPDLTSPTPGNSGFLTISNVTYSFVILGWVIATDNLSPKTALQYQMIRSEFNNIQTVSDAKLNGLDLSGLLMDITTYSDTTVVELKEYYYTLLVHDEANNVEKYETLKITTPDGTPPVPGNSGILQVNGLYATMMILGWNKATDNVSPQDALEYGVYRSNTNNISTLSDAIANGTNISGWIHDIDSYTDTTLTSVSTYYYTVLVRDEQRLLSSYQSLAIVTP